MVLYMDPELMVHDGHVHDYFVDNKTLFLHVTYTAQITSKNTLELTQVLNIETVLLRIKNKEAKQNMIQEEVHQICAVLKKNARTEPISLGRAQMIHTSLEKNRRTYGWLPKVIISPREKSKESVLPLSFISPRVRFSEDVDHDGFTNQDRILPVLINEADCPVLTLQFFNMKDKPPRFLEWSMRWGTFLDRTTPPPSPFVRRLSNLKTRRKSATNRKRYNHTENITEHVSVTVVYCFENINKESILIEEIYLVAKDYKKSLESMNDYVIPRTI
jgi:hypothetical protein